MYRHNNIMQVYVLSFPLFSQSLITLGPSIFPCNNHPGQCRGLIFRIRELPLFVTLLDHIISLIFLSIVGTHTSTHNINTFKNSTFFLVMHTSIQYVQQVPRRRTLDPKRLSYIGTNIIFIGRRHTGIAKLVRFLLS